MPANAPSSFRPPGELEFATALAPYSGPWSSRLAAHLARRAGFGGTPQEIAHLRSLTPGAAVDAFVHFADASSLAASPSDLPSFAPLGALANLRNYKMLDPQARADLQKQIGAARRAGAISLQTWWLDRMLRTPAPLQEKMTLFWHGHYTTAYGAKGVTPQDALRQNQLFRSFALGNAHALTLAVAQDPAMLKYLDNARNNKTHPNENFARELMELYTLGRGNYTEADVRESARAFTGWTVERPLLGGGFVFNQRAHDDGSKTFLGHSGNFDGKAIIDIIYTQPAAARWLAAKLLNAFVYNDPEPQLIDATAALIRKNAFEVGSVISTLLRSNVFYSERAYRALVKSPVELVVSSMRLFGLRDVNKTVLASLVRMGQTLFYPPDVKGWDGGAAWLNSQTVLTRENFASALANDPQAVRIASVVGGFSTDPHAVARKLVDVMLEGDASPASIAGLVAYLGGSETSALGALSGENFDERVRGAAYLTMAMPAYQLN